MGNGTVKRLFARYVTGTDRTYAELGPVGKLVRLLWISADRYISEQNSLRAVALTYYTLFAVVPMLALAFGIAKGFGLQEKLQEILNEKLATQSEVLAWISEFAKTTLAQAQGGIIAGVGVVVLLITVMSLVNSVEKSFNSIWHLPKRGNLFRRLSTYLSLMLVTPFLIIILSGAGPLLRRLLLSQGDRIGMIGMELCCIAAEFFPLILLCGTFALIYLVIPNTRVRFLSAIMGGIVAGILFQLLQDGFIFLQTSIYRYNKVYGSFAILPLFLIWLKLSWQIALFGVEVSFIYQHARSGLFDRLVRKKLSPKLRHEYQLLILGKIYRQFDLGGGTISEERICDEIPLPQVLTLSLLEELVDAGVLYRIEDEDEEPGYLPAQPTDRFTMCDALERLDVSGMSDPPVSSDAFERVVRNLDGVKRTAATSGCNLLLKELGPS